MDSDEFDGEPPSNDRAEDRQATGSDTSTHSQRLSLHGIEDLANPEHLGNREASTASITKENLHSSWTQETEAVSHFGIESNENAQFGYHRDWAEGSLTSQTSHPSNHSPQHLARADSDGSTSTGATPNEELTESKFFSHDEAQSLYMSAMSKGGDESFIPNMPGGWDSFGTSRVSDSEHASSVGPKDAISSSSQNLEPQDEGNTSTPKQGLQTGSYFEDQQASQSIQSESQFPNMDNPSIPSPTNTNKSGEMQKVVLNVDKVSIWLPTLASLENPSPTPPKMSLEKTDSENQSIGIILCADKDHVDVEIALQDINKPIGVADYQLSLPKKELQTLLLNELQAGEQQNERFE